MPFYAPRSGLMPELVAGEATMEAFRGCQLAGYTPIEVPSIAVDEEIVAYASPDSTYAVTKRMFDGATKSIRIGIYDFTAQYMKTLLLNAMSRGVKVTLMLDVETANGERALFQELIDMGVEGVVAPSCTSPNAHYFASCHEKFIVIDDLWTLVQSGNFSDNSVPLNEKDGGDPAHFVSGNRDTGLAVRSSALAGFFTRVLRSDIALTLSTPKNLAEAATPEAADVLWLEAVPTRLPTTLFPSKTFKLRSALSIQPVLSPDNYLTVIPDMLRQAGNSILIEQQYIRSSQPEIGILLAAIAEARKNNPKLDVRIVLGKIFGTADFTREQQNLKLLASSYGLVLGDNIRYIDTTRLVHCHNKMVIVDGVQVLVSSQNWSDFAIVKNREAGLLLSHMGIAAYFTAIFETDWATAFQKLPAPGKPQVDLGALKRGGFVRVVPADYREV